MNLRFTLLLIGLLAVIVSCASTPTPVPTTVPPTAVPTTPPQPTAAPTNTPLPRTPTTAPTITIAPATNTPIPTSPTPTATNTRPPVTAAPPTDVISPTATAVVVKYGAAELLEPKQGDTRRVRKDAFVFRWNPVGDLAANECYLLRLRITHLADPNRNYGQATYLVESSCNSAVGSGVVEFVVNGRAPAPNYDGLVDEANALAGIDSQEYLVEWDVTVVLNENGVLTPIGETSAVGQFTLLNN